MMMQRIKEKSSFLLSGLFGTDRSKAPEEISREIFGVIHKKREEKGAKGFIIISCDASLHV
jgi:hypothetical protein